MSSYNAFGKITGAHIVSAHYDGSCIYLQTLDRGCIRLQPEGDCCSSCFIADVCGSEALASGATILSVEDCTKPQPERQDGDDVVDVWGHRITTDKGQCVIGMRLDHNGYYGGWLNVEDVDHCPGKPLEDFS